jgi:hypothetical protein|tara:strand:- start:2028 stop:3530 length:1503 start_codon:yes stop_codon:yes gene_type:complete
MADNEAVEAADADSRALFGAAQTPISGVAPENIGALGNLSQSTINLLGGQDAVRSAVALAKELIPKQEPFDPDLAAFLFFTKMGEAASKPGATALGAAATGAQEPVKYLMEKRKNDRAAQAAVGPMAVQLTTLVNKQGAAASKPYTNKNTGEVEHYTPRAFNALPSRSHLVPYKAPPKQSSSAPERRRDGVLRVVEALSKGQTVNAFDVTKALTDAQTLQTDTKIPVTDQETGETIIITQKGIDILGIAAGIYGEDVVKRLKEFKATPAEVPAVTSPADAEAPAEAPAEVPADADADKKEDTYTIGDRTFTVISRSRKSIPKEAAQGMVDAKGGMADMNIAYKIFFPAGKYNSNIAAFGVAGDTAVGLVSRFGSRAAENTRTAKQAMSRSIELLLRARSGAAVPDSEVKKYVDIYSPSVLDNAVQAKAKLDRLGDYFKDTLTLLGQGKFGTNGGFGPNPTDISIPDQETSLPAGATTAGSKFIVLPNGKIAVKKKNDAGD